MTVYILMGVSGCGKSTIGRKAAEQLDILFLEGDDYHPISNIAKMREGIALTDKDREPWVDAMIESCNQAFGRPQQTEQSIILACSALSKSVRKRLREGLSDSIRFIHLHGEPALLKTRLSDRKGHFFKPELLASQFAALDIPRGAATLDIAQPVGVLVGQLCDIIQSKDET